LPDITIKVEAPGLATAILALAEAVNGKNLATAGLNPTATQAVSTQAVPTQQAPMQQAPMQQAPMQQAPMQQAPMSAGFLPALQSLQQEHGLPVQQPPMQPQSAVPTAPQTYTLEQLAVAGTQLVDQGRRAELVGLLTKFGADALTSLAKEYYGAFATELRQMGARL